MGKGGTTDEGWNLGTMFSQLARRSTRMLAKGLRSKPHLLNSLQWPIYVINSDYKTKLPLISCSCFKHAVMYMGSDWIHFVVVFCAITFDNENHNRMLKSLKLSVNYS